MADQEENKQNGERRETQTGGGQSQSGDPGRTPGSAEGDRETVEEDLRQKQG